MKLSTLMTVAGAVLWNSVGWAGPIISPDQPTYDFGTIAQGREIEHRFTLRNRGDAPLTVGRLKTSCGCTAATVSAKTIPPGKIGIVNVTFNSLNFAGKVHKTITIESNDPHTPAATLVLKGTVAEEIVLSPRSIEFDGVKRGSRTAAVITLTNRGSSPLSVIAVKSPLPQVAAKIRKSRLAPGEVTEILLEITPKGGDCYLNGYITVLTDNRLKPELAVPLYAPVTP